MRRTTVLCLALMAATSFAQQAPAPAGAPAAQQIHVDGVKMDLPFGWTWTREDGEVSYFRDDVRSLSPKGELVGVASISYNPLPPTTFSGALVYITRTRGEAAEACVKETTVQLPKEPAAIARFPEPLPPAKSPSLPGVSFAHGHDAHGIVCTEERDEFYTAMHAGACYRVDLVLHTFCGGEAGSRDMTQQEIDEIRGRMNAVFATFRFD